MKKHMRNFMVAAAIALVAPFGLESADTPTPTVPDVVLAEQGPTATPEAKATSKPKAKSTKPSRPKLRAGLDEKQMQHAVTIVETGQEMGLPRRAYEVAIATGLQESQLRVLANVNVPESFDYQPRDGYGRDHDSVGIFQQRVSLYAINDVKWAMDPRYSSIKFYNGLKRIPNWEQMSVAEAAQAVQVSAFPDAYAKHEGKAKLIVDSILEWQEQQMKQ